MQVEFHDNGTQLVVLSTTTSSSWIHSFYPSGTGGRLRSNAAIQYVQAHATRKGSETRLRLVQIISASNPPNAALSTTAFHYLYLFDEWIQLLITNLLLSLSVLYHWHSVHFILLLFRSRMPSRSLWLADDSFPDRLVPVVKFPPFSK